MNMVAVGDRVQILCTSTLGDGTAIDCATERAEPYWIRAQAADGELRRASEAVVGMQVGERRALMIGRDATAAKDACTVIHVLEVRAIRKAASSKP